MSRLQVVTLIVAVISGAFGLITAPREGKCADVRALDPAYWMGPPPLTPREPTGGPAGVPGDGLKASLRLSTDPDHPYRDALPIDVEVINVSQAPMEVHAGTFPVLPFRRWLLLFDAAGNALHPANIEMRGITALAAGYSGPDPRPVELKPGEAVTVWRWHLFEACNSLGLEPGEYRPQVLLATAQPLPQLPGRYSPQVLISNIVTFQWMGSPE